MKKVSILIMSVILLTTVACKTQTKTKSLIVGNSVVEINLGIANQMLSDSNEAFYENMDSVTVQYSELKSKTDALIQIIDDLKSEIILSANGKTVFYRITRNQANTDIPEELLIATGKATDLKSRIRDYVNFISTNESIFHFQEEAKVLLNTDDSQSAKGSMISWEVLCFTDVSAISVISILTGLQTNIITCESVILRKKVCPSKP